MKLRKSEIIIVGIILFSFAISFYVYPRLPEQVASHWNIRGEVDGYMSRFLGAFYMPILSVILGVLFFIVPRIDPKKNNIEKFREYFDNFTVLMFLFLLYLYFLVLSWNFGYRFNIGASLSPALGLLFYYIGVMISHAELNWSIGLRTPWSLSSKEVWAKTHKLGGKLFKASGLVATCGIFMPSYAFWLVILPVTFSSLVAAIFSYLEFRKLHGK
ncbi:MAG: SdpI family protein [Patescibacteria group bacterium]|jgi:uncharacterized membrane protein